MQRLMLTPMVTRTWTNVVRHCETATSGQKTRMVRPTSMQKNYLLWSKTFKTAEDIPSEISYSKLKRATDWARIRINIAMCLAAVIGCVTFVYAGKKEHSWGFSAEKENLAWHKKVNQQAKDKAEHAAAHK